MATLKEFEEALKSYNMVSALAVLDELRKRDKAGRTVSRARRVAGRKMTPGLAREVLELHKSTEMTQQEIAFKLGVNQGRVNEVIKHGKWLSGDPSAPEVVARDKALARMTTPPRPPKPARPHVEADRVSKPANAVKASLSPRRIGQNQLSLGDF